MKKTKKDSFQLDEFLKISKKREKELDSEFKRIYSESPMVSDIINGLRKISKNQAEDVYLFMRLGRKYERTDRSNKMLEGLMDIIGCCKD